MKSVVPAQRDHSLTNKRDLIAGLQSATRFLETERDRLQAIIDGTPMEPILEGEEGRQRAAKEVARLNSRIRDFKALTEKAPA